MVYKRYITKNGKKLGPYYYKSIRGFDGRIKSVYVGQKPEKNFTLHPKAREALLITLIVMLCFSAFFVLKPTITGYGIYENGTNESTINETALEINQTINETTPLQIENYTENITLNETIYETINQTNETITKENVTIETNITLNETESSEPEINETIKLNETQEKIQEDQNINETTEVQLTTEKTEKEVLDQLNRNGEARVIIKLKNPPKIDFKNKIHAQQAMQTISQKQDAVLSKLDYVDERIKPTKGVAQKKEFKLISKFESINAFAGRITKEGLAKLQKENDVEEIILDRPVKAFLDTSVPLINATEVWKKNIDGINISGRGQTVCIIDTGIQQNHPAFGNRVIGQKCYCSDYCCPGAVVESDNATDDSGHGTHVAGIIASQNETYKGVAYEANLVAVKVLNASGYGYTSDVVSGIDWCRTNKDLYNITVISMSLGGGAYSNYCDSTSDAQAVNNAVAAGIFVAVASGNENSYTTISSPACASNATAVAATDDTDTVASFSNTNSLLDLFGPGVDITSSWLGSTWTSKQGTSMATPHVAGAAALIIQYEKLYNNITLKPQEVELILKSYGKNVTDTRNGLTRPRINVLNSIENIYKINKTENSISSKNAKIVFFNETDFSNFISAFILEKNFIHLNDNYTKFNKSANVTLYNLSFEKTPVVYKNGILCLSPSCNITSYLGNNLSFIVSSFSNYSAGENSRLEIFNTADLEPCFRLLKDAQITFYANYTNITNGASISTGTCNITFSDTNKANLVYNSSSLLYEFNRSFSSIENYNYTITCSDSNFESLQTSDNFTILTNQPNCTIPPPNCQWEINGDYIVTCENENLLLQNQSLKISGNATFKLIGTNLTLDNASADQGIFAEENTTLLFNYSTIKSLAGFYYFDVKVNGTAIFDNVVLNQSKLYIYGNKIHNLSNSKFYSDFDDKGGGINNINNCSFYAVVYFQGSSINLINDSTFYGAQTYFMGATNNTINTINCSQQVLFQDSSYSVVSNSYFNDSVFGLSSGWRIVDFTGSQSKLNAIYRFRIYNTTIRGFVDMPPNLTDIFQTGSKVFRYYPIYVNYSNGLPAANKEINIKNGATLIWSGTTNATGWAEPNLTFNSTNYNEIYNLTINPTLNISLFTDTPIVVTLDYGDNNAPNVTLILPENNNLSFAGNTSFYFNVSDDSEISNCSLIIDGAINQTDKTINKSEILNFTLDLEPGNYQWSVNCTDEYNNTGASETRNITINKFAAYCYLEFNLASPQTYGVLVNASCSCTNPEAAAQLFRNNANANSENNQNILLSGGAHNYTCNASATSNYNYAENSSVYQINKALPNLILLSIPSWNLTYGDARNVSCYTNITLLNVSLLRNNSIVSNPDTQPVAAGSYEYYCNTTENENYSSAETYELMNIAKANHTIHLALNGFENDLNVAYGTETNTTGGLEITQEIDRAILDRDGLQVATGSPATELANLPAGTYVYTYTYPQSQNYTAQAISRTLTIARATSTCSLTFDLASPQVYGTQITPNCTCTNPEAQEDLTVDNYPITNNFPIQLSAGNHSFNCSVAQTQNYTYAEDLDNFTIIPGAVDLPPIVVLVNPPENSTITQTLVNFTYIPADDYNISNCTLFINYIKNQTNYDIINGAYNYFSVNLTEGNYTWAVNCSDNSSNTAEAKSYFIINTTYGTANCTQSLPSCGSWSSCSNSIQSRTCTIYDYNNICNNPYIYTQTQSCNSGGSGGGGGSSGGFVPKNKTKEKVLPEEKPTIISVLGEAMKETKDWIFQPVSQKPKHELPQKCITCWVIPCGDYWLVVILLALIMMISYLLVKRRDIAGYFEERKEKKSGLEIKINHQKDFGHDFREWEIVSIALFLFAMPLIIYWLSTICWALIVLLVELIYIIYEFFRKDDFSREIRENIEKSKDAVNKNDFDEANSYYKKAIRYYHKSNEKVKNKFKSELEELSNNVFELIDKNIKSEKK